MALRNELLYYQHEAADKLIKLKVGALFMEQGTGKTITALELCCRRMECNKIEHLLWLCPCSAKENIKKELIKQAPHEILGNTTICGIESLSTSLRIITYLMQLVEEKKCFLVVDESLLVKNIKAYRTKNIINIAQKCAYKLILNGTPISKNEADLFSQFYLLDWRILGYQSYWQFEANHLEYDVDNPKKVVRCLNTEYLARKIEPYVFQIRKNECLKLPDKKYHTSYFYLTDEQEEHYYEVANRTLMDLDELRPETIYRMLTAIQAVTCGRKVSFKKDEKGYEHIETNRFFDNVYNNPRMQLLMEIVDKAVKTIIFCKYTDEITDIYNILNKKFGEGTAVRFDGSVNIKRRNENINCFSQSASFLIANRHCAGFSLNLQFCHRIICYSNDWDYAKRIQSEDRVHRIGQTEDIEIIDICAAETIDERIKKCLDRKQNLSESFKNEISCKRKAELEEWLYVRKNRKYSKNKTKVFDCSDLEDEYAENF